VGWRQREVKSAWPRWTMMSPVRVTMDGDVAIQGADDNATSIDAFEKLIR